MIIKHRAIFYSFGNGLNSVLLQVDLEPSSYTTIQDIGDNIPSYVIKFGFLTLFVEMNVKFTPKKKKKKKKKIKDFSN